jgi:signal transduction histidine kinase
VYSVDALPEPLATALRSQEPLLRGDLEEHDETHRLAANSASGIYVRLETRNTTIGLLGLEHPELGHFDERDIRVLVGLAEVLALTIDNARWFGRLRSLGAEEERIRLARDLHDRLGQWLTYIGFELERIMATDVARVEDLDRLHRDVQAALDELRETLRQLRSGVTEEQPFSDVARDVVNRFGERADLDARLVVVHPGNRLAVPVENELLRILQEALNNVGKHATADSVLVTWNVDGGSFELTIADDGRGFETARGVRDSAYGLVGMRERADVIGAQLSIDSRPGAGTTVRVAAGISPTRSTTRPSLPMGRT